MKDANGPMFREVFSGTNGKPDTTLGLTKRGVAVFGIDDP